VGFTVAMKNLNIRVPDELLEELDGLVDDRYTSRSEAVRHGVRQLIAAEKAEREAINEEN